MTYALAGGAIEPGAAGASAQAEHDRRRRNREQRARLGGAWHDAHGYLDAARGFLGLFAEAGLGLDGDHLGHRRRVNPDKLARLGHPLSPLATSAPDRG